MFNTFVTAAQTFVPRAINTVATAAAANPYAAATVAVCVTVLAVPNIVVGVKQNAEWVRSAGLTIKSKLHDMTAPAATVAAAPILVAAE